MTFVVADRVQENGTVATGTGSVTLSGAVNGYQSFASGIGNNNTTYYTIYDPVSYAWEVGLGTVTTGPNTLARTTVYANSAGTQPSNISFSTSDTLTVFVTYPAEIAIYTAASASLNSLSLTSSITGSSNKGSLNYGTLSYSDTNIFASYQTSVNSYAQMIIQNSNNGTAASADLVVSSDGGTASTNYGDFGINSSTYSGTGPLNAASMVYLYSQSTDLTIGTNTANAIHFTINNAATDALTINTTGSIAVNGQTGSVGQVLISQGSSNPPSWGNAGGNLVVTDFTATAGQTTFTLSYVVGTVSVYRNGIKLGLADFTATNGSTVVLATGAAAGDLIEIQSFTTLTLYSSITSQDFSGNGSTTAFTMNTNPANSASVLVAINGVVQDPANYTVSGNTLTFTTAPATGTNNISCRYLGVPSTTSVSSFSAGTTGFSPTTAASGAVTLSGILAVTNGGTGLNSLTSGYIPYGNGTGAFASSSGFNFNGTTLTSPALALSVSALTSSNIGNYAMGGALSFSDTGITSSEVGTTNSYLQAVIQNKSNGSLASAEYIVYNDQGTASTNYATVGINSSGYTGTGSINAAGYGYFLTGSTDLVLGTIGNNAIHFAVNSGATDAMYISSAGNVGIGTNNPTQILSLQSAAGYDPTTAINIINGATDFGRTQLRLTGRLQAGNDGWSINGRNNIIFAVNSATSGNNIGALGTDTYALQFNMLNNQLGFLNTALGSGATPLLYMSSNGAINMPYQPSFAVCGYGQPTVNSGTTGILPGANVSFNIGSYYSTSTYRFTAPMRGSYLFICRIVVTSGTQTATTGTIDQNLGFLVNGSYYGAGASGYYGGGFVGYYGYYTASNIILLNAGDYVQVGFSPTGTNFVMRWDMSTFSGQLLS